MSGYAQEPYSDGMYTQKQTVTTQRIVLRDANFVHCHYSSQLRRKVWSLTAQHKLISTTQIVTSAHKKQGESFLFDSVWRPLSQNVQITLPRVQQALATRVAASREAGMVT
uniref:Uncharacterized protein n=1 Tax=Pseudictyota dubia TaxID=2749911 RepID=A0A7R9VBK6_9STRA|mmetsp:Transcript_10411/g.19965  ORF Transcript_10411/g.19965 Transcript_10411/m.19965 type:complete len:111 (+) Transcript_10411:36-368(+)